MVLAQLLIRKKTKFVLWRPRFTNPRPALFIGNFLVPSPTPFENFTTHLLQQSSQFPDLWEIDASSCGLTDGQVYYYWFKVRDGIEPSPVTEQVLYITDPLAYSVDRNLSAPIPSEASGITRSQPASLILYKGGELLPTDSTGLSVNLESNTYLANLKPNHSTVIYELPTRWVRKSSNTNDIDKTVGVGTFQDCLSLVDKSTISPSFPSLDEINQSAHLLDLGINVLELLPPADSPQVSEWGYGTSHYFAPDFDLGRPSSNSQSTAVRDLNTLIQRCHDNGIRFYLDAVIAFSVNNPQFNVNFSDFFESGNTGFGGNRLRYELQERDNPPQIYDPVTGQSQQNYPFVPARRFMMAHISHWIHFYHIDGIRIDNVSGINNWDFLSEFTSHSRNEWQNRGGSSDRFIVIGEELSVPTDLVRQNRLDSLWNEKFKVILRQVILGQNAQDGINEPSFEWSVRKLIDCRLLGFSDGAQAVNYIGSHDVGGFKNERFYNYLQNNHIYDKLQRFKLAFACLMTAVGTPMIFAGDEFADQQDLNIYDKKHDPNDRNKQIDPVNFSRKSESWRKELFDYVSRLVKFRIASESLSVNDTDFIHIDFTPGRRVLVWRRGQTNSPHPVIVVANFSDWGSDPSGEYQIPRWPYNLGRNHWLEVTQDRKVDPNWVGREPIYPWEAKVYTLI